MKKIALLIMIMTALVFSACGTYSKAEISEEKAKEIALKQAGVKEEDVTFAKSEKDRDDGRTVYEVEFYTKDRTEYDYEIDANTGAVISYDSDMESKLNTDNIPMTDNTETGNNNTDNTQESVAGNTTSGEGNLEITEQQAKEIALEKVPGASEKDIKEFKKDRDDGKIYYEGKIVYEKKEYEFEIDAQTGAITDWDADSIYD